MQSKLEKHIVLRITTQTISAVADVIGGAESVGIRNRLINEIHRERQHNELEQKANILRAYVKEIKKQLFLVEHKLKQVEEKMAGQKMDSTLAPRLPDNERPCTTKYYLSLP